MSTPPSGPPARAPFASEPGTDVAKRIDRLRSAGEALDTVLSDAKRFVERSSLSRAAHLVLVVDDAEDVRELLAAGLSEQGFRVVQATDGADAIAKTIALSPDVIVMDYSMPGMDGGEAARRLAADALTRSIPILLLSAFPDVIPREVRLGCAAFLAKPCAPEELGSLLYLMLAARGGFER